MSSKSRRGRILWTTAVALIALSSAAFGETTFTVNSTDDLPDANPGDGICDADLDEPGEQCTLRAAVQEANATNDQVIIEVPAGRYRLRVRGAFEDAAATGDLDISGDVVIRRTGATDGIVVIDGKKLKDRIFDVVSISGSLRLENIIVTKGSAPSGESGGGVRSLSGTLVMVGCTVSKCKSKDDAGGVDIGRATVTLIDCVIEKNKARDDGAGIDVDFGVVTLQGCVFSKNKARDDGGALESSGGDVTLSNCTFARNKARREGGALNLEDGARTTITACEFTRNRAKTGAAIATRDIALGANDTTISSSQFSKNKRQSCVGIVTDGGGNTVDDNSCDLGDG